MSRVTQAPSSREPDGYPLVPAVKLLSDSLQHLRLSKSSICIGSIRVSCIEMAGVCIEKDSKFIRILDFCGEVPMTKRAGTEIADTPCVFMCVPYVKGGAIRLFCKAARKIDVFEEMFFWAEAVSYRRECIQAHGELEH
jgi:hypothetical protein